MKVDYKDLEGVDPEFIKLWDKVWSKKKYTFKLFTDEGYTIKQWTFYQKQRDYVEGGYKKVWDKIFSDKWSKKKWVKADFLKEGWTEHQWTYY